jgi:hypothetical protein
VLSSVGGRPHVRQKRLNEATVSFIQLIGSLLVSVRRRFRREVGLSSCISGGLIGAGAGHLVHHGVLGAVGGCVVRHELHKHAVHQERMRSQEPYYSNGYR